MISIIIRTKDEERWIGLCLNQIKSQSFKDFEVILVDNNSIDNTVVKAKKILPEIICCSIDKFTPGKALNLGIKKSKGEFIVCLSAHCIPVNEFWLENLYNEIKSEEKIAGVYGRQLPMDQTHDIDRRDMYITFGLDRRVQIKDPFFHNANSIIRKDLWDEVSFNENELNIEDRIWGKKIIEKGYMLVYTPEAMVYHLHGIHQTNKNKRYKNIARIIEETSSNLDAIPIEKYNLCAIVPILAEELNDKLKFEVFLDTLKLIQEIKYFSLILITTDNVQNITKRLKNKHLAPIPLIYHERKYDNKRLLNVYTDTIKFLGHNNIFPDIILTADISYPIKSKKIFESCLFELLKNDVDAVIPAYSEKRPTWIKKEDEYLRVDNYEISKEDREPVFVGLENICFAVYANRMINYEVFFKNKIEMVVSENPFYRFKIDEIKNLEEYRYIKQRSNNFEKKNE